MAVTTLPARRVRFRDLLYGVAKRAGLAPEAEGIPGPVAAEITEGINTCYKIAWEYYDWPETLKLAPVTFDNPEDNRILWDITTLDIANVHGLYEVCASDPNPTTPSKRGAKIPFQLTADGIIPTTHGRESLLVDYKREAPQFSYIPWEAARNPLTYYPDDVVYNPVDGCCYKRLANLPAAGRSTALVNTGSFLNSVTVAGGDLGDIGPITGANAAALLAALLANDDFTSLYTAEIVEGTKVLISTLVDGPPPPSGDIVPIPFIVQASSNVFVLETLGHVAPDYSLEGSAWQVILPLKFLAEAVKAGAHGAYERAEEQHATASLLESAMGEFLDHEIDQLELHGNGGVYSRTSGRRR